MAEHEIYSGENQKEETLLLMGRINALASYLESRRSSGYVDTDTVAAIMGFKLNSSVEDFGV